MVSQHMSAAQLSKMIALDLAQMEIDGDLKASAEAPTQKGFFDWVAKRCGSDDGFPTPAGNGNVMELFVDTTGTNLVPSADLADIISANNLHYALV